MFDLNFLGGDKREENKSLDSNNIEKIEKTPEQIVDKINARVADILGAKNIFPDHPDFQEELQKATDQALEELRTDKKAA